MTFSFLTTAFPRLCQPQESLRLSAQTAWLLWESEALDRHQSCPPLHALRQRCIQVTSLFSLDILLLESPAVSGMKPLQSCPALCAWRRREIYTQWSTPAPMSSLFCGWDNNCQLLSTCYVLGPPRLTRYFIMVSTSFAFNTVAKVSVESNWLEQTVGPALISSVSSGIHLSEPRFHLWNR